MLFPSRTSNSNKFLIDIGSLYNGILSYDINVDRVRMHGARMAGAPRKVGIMHIACLLDELHYTGKNALSKWIIKACI